MEQSNGLLRIFNTIFPFGDFLYILQQEEYSSRRYIKWLGRFFFRRNIQVRDTLKYTSRAKILFFFSVILWVLALALALLSVRLGALVHLLLLIVFIVGIPLFVLLGNIILHPLFSMLRHRAMKKASEKVDQYKNLKIIAVAGSFGKTTTKNFIYDLVRYNFHTELIPENINTPMGIANWVSAHLSPRTQLLIVEMDAYRIGEIKESCLITPPDIAIITTIGDQHLERFGAKESLAAALAEVFVYAKPSAQLICNADTAQRLAEIMPKERPLIIADAKDLDMVKSHPEIIARFSSSNLTNLSFALRTAKLLGVPDAFIVDTCKKMELPDRRQKATTMYGYECVDDSYNISFTTAQAGIAFARAMADAKKKKLLVVTAGIPELGPEDRDKNEALGKVLSIKADHVALLKSMFYREIVHGIPDAQHYTLFKNFQEFIHQAPNKFPPGEWFVLFQPELTDLYY